MKFLLDKSPTYLLPKIKEYPDIIHGQFLSANRWQTYWGGSYAIDNGAYAGFDNNSTKKFERLLVRQESDVGRCLFVVVPDVVCNARRTLELWKYRYEFDMGDFPLAFVGQNGIEDMEVPWDEMECYFVGGDDRWKMSKASADLVKVAKALGKHVHIGRINSISRFMHFHELGADTCDGSGVAKFEDAHQIFLGIRNELNNTHPTLFDVLEDQDGEERDTKARAV